MSNRIMFQVLIRDVLLVYCLYGGYGIYLSLYSEMHVISIIYKVLLKEFLIDESTFYL